MTDFSEFFNRNDYFLITPAVLLALFGCGILLIDFLHDARQKFMNAVTALVGLVFTGYQLIRIQGQMDANGLTELPGLRGALMLDHFGVFFMLVCVSATFISILISIRYLEIEQEHHGEYYALMLFSLMGMYFMITGMELVTLFIGLETMALSGYVLAGFLRRDKRSNEGAMKYFLLGAFSSGLLAFGFSLLFGISGSTNLQNIAQALAQRPTGDALASLALITTATGLLFKVAAVPFHQWAPDAYEGAPTSVTGFLSTAPKAAAFAFLMRIFLVGLSPMRPSWAPMLTAIAIVTMTVGNLAAITQNNTKRLFAYSSVSHVGYILLGLVAGNETGLKGIAVYVLVYAFMNLGAFAVLVALRRADIIGDEIEDLSGLFFRNPGAAVMMLIFLLSLAGIPPLAGFLGKYFIFLSLIETGHTGLAAFAVLYVAVGLYYYMRMTVMMFMREPANEEPLSMSPGVRIALGLTLAATVIIGLYPEPVIQLASSAIIH
jgi:NADH-quinone oxidoreductase subunit N